MSSLPLLVSLDQLLMYVLIDLDSMATYYWRVDVVSGDESFDGRVWMFRLAHLAFPGAEGYG